MKSYINKIAAVILFVVISLTSVQRSTAAASIGLLELLRHATVKVIKAIDLKIQRLQNQTIWLQNAQKVIENQLSKTNLDDIADWTERQKQQYDEYFEELKNVKSVIVYYQRVRDISQKQLKLISEYNRAWQLLRQDYHFNGKELEYMEKVYSGILKESLNNMEDIAMVVRSFSLQMNDSKRLEMINAAADRVDVNFDDLMQFNRQNMLLSLGRAKTQKDIEVVKKLYGLE